MMRTGSTGNYSVTLNRTASWCPNCGRRRNPDGRCPDCDPWWTSPVVQYGGPLSLLIVLALLGGIALTQSHNSSRQVRSLPAIVGNPGNTRSYGMTYPANPYGGYSSPRMYNPPAYTAP